MKLRSITALVRLPNFSDFFERMIAIGALIVGIVAFGYEAIHQAPLMDAALAGVNLAILLYLLWAFSREVSYQIDLSEDHSRPSVPLLITGIFVVNIFTGHITTMLELEILAMIWLLFAVRATTGIVGSPLTWLDILFLTIVGGWIMYDQHFAFGILLVFSFRFESQTGNKKELLKALMYLSGAAVVVLGVWQLWEFFQNQWDVFIGDLNYKVFIFAFLLPFIVNAFLTLLKPEWLPRKYELDTLDDTNGEPLSYQRLAFALIALMFVAIFLLIFELPIAFFTKWMPIVYTFIFVGVWAFFTDLGLYATPNEKKKIWGLWGTVFFFGVAVVIHSIFSFFASFAN